MAWVSTSPLVKTYTLDEFWQLAEPPDRSKLELIAGVLYMTPPPEQTHDDVVTRINRLLTIHLVTTNNRDKLYVPHTVTWTGPNTYLDPDLFYISAELEERLNQQLLNTADLVIEVTSPGSAIYDRNTKADTYGALGVRELWLVDETTETVEVRYQIGSGFDEGRTFQRGEQIISVVLPALEIRVEQIFTDEG